MTVLRVRPFVSRVCILMALIVASDGVTYADPPPQPDKPIDPAEVEARRPRRGVCVRPPEPDPAPAQPSGENSGGGTRGGCDAERMLRFTGRIVLERPDGNVVGVDTIWVKVKDEDSPVEDDTIVEGFTDEDGNFDLSAWWDSIDCPDVYVEWECETDSVVVQHNIALQIDYTWNTEDSPHMDFGGTEIHFGWLGVADSAERPALHIHNNITRARRWIANVAGIDTPRVDVMWPFDVNGPFYFSGQIYIDSDAAWEGSTHVHEYGHHFMSNFMPNGHVIIPDYCNGVCDNTILFFDVPCGHCAWCGENDTAAWNEGWANWLGDVVHRHIDASYPHGALNWVWNDATDVFQPSGDWSFETPRGCVDTSQPLPDPNDPDIWHGEHITEGFVAALLRDLEDPDVDAPGDAFRPDPGDPGSPGPAPACALDALAEGPEAIFEVSLQDDPTNVIEFIAAFRARFPAVAGRAWRTAFNLGREDYVPADTTPPGAVTQLSSPTHPSPGGGNWPAIRVVWSPAPDAESGAETYDLGWSTSPQGPLVAVQQVRAPYPGPLQADSPPLELGMYWLRIQATDCVGNASNSVSWFGPFVITECNGNGIVDVCETPLGCSLFPQFCFIGNCSMSPDCDADGAPDACEIATGEELDCNVNGVPDDCEAINFVRWEGCVHCGCPPSNPGCTPVVDCTWDGVTCWDNQHYTRWTNGGVPGPNDHVCVEDIAGVDALVYNSGNSSVRSLGCYEGFALSGGELSLAEPSAFYSAVAIDGGILTGNGDIDFDGPVTWRGGNLYGGGASTAIGGVLFASNVIRDIGRNFLNEGTARLQDGNLGLSHGAVFENAPDQLFDVQVQPRTPPQSMLWWSGAQPGTFNNAGTLRKSFGSGTFVVSVPLENSGRVEVLAGTLSLNSAVTSSGLVTAGQDAVFRIGGGTQTYSGPVTLTSLVLDNGTSRFTGPFFAAEARMNNGTHNFDLPGPGAAIMQSFIHAAGALEGSGNVRITQMLTVNQGNQYGSGTTWADGEMLLTGAVNVTRDIGRHFVNNGTATLHQGDLGLSQGAVFDNAQGRLFEVQVPARTPPQSMRWWSGTQPGEFHNAGTLRKSLWPGTFLISVPLENTGLIEVQTGTLSLESRVDSSGSVTGAPGAVFRINGGTQTYSGPVGPQTIHLVSGTTTFTGPFDVGAATITGGTHNFNSPSPDAPAIMQLLTHNGGAIQGRGDLRIVGMLTMMEGFQYDSGTTYANGGMTMSGSVSVIRDIGRHFVNNGTATLQEGNVGLSQGAVFENALGSVFDVQVPSASPPQALRWWSGTQPGTFDNDGTFRKSVGAGTFAVRVPLTNSGTVDVQTGTLSLESTVNSSGSVNGAPGAILLVNGGTQTYSGPVTPRTLHLALGTTTFTGPFDVGDATISNGTHNFDAPDPDVPALMQTCTHNGGVIQGTGDLRITGLLAMTGGNQYGSGTTWADGGLTLSSTLIRDFGRHFVNSGTATMLDGSLGLSRGAVFDNTAGALFDVRVPGNHSLRWWTGAQPGVFNNDGTFRKSPGTATTTVSVPFNNTGTVELLGGLLDVTSSYTQTAGLTVLDGGALQKTGTALAIQGGRLAGNGTITGNVDNSGGTAAPGLSAGELVIAGNYTQGSAGTLEIELGGAVPVSEHDRLTVSGTATLGGTLAISLINGFMPANGDEFTILTAGTISGTFATLLMPPGVPGVVIYNPDSVVLRIEPSTPCPGDISGDGAVGLSDLTALLGSFGLLLGDPAYNPAADLNGDEQIGISDLTILLGNFGNVCP